MPSATPMYVVLSTARPCPQGLRVDLADHLCEWTAWVQAHGHEGHAREPHKCHYRGSRNSIQEAITGTKTPLPIWVGVQDRERPVGDEPLK